MVQSTMVQSTTRTVRRARTISPGSLALLAATLFATIAAAGYPKPAPVSRSWELDFEPGPLRLYLDRQTGESYWYFTYVVSNESGADRIWAPQFTLFTDTGKILESGRDVPPDITTELIELLGNDLLEQQNEAIGDVFQGPEHAIDGIVIWPARNLKVNEISLFIAGVSGETARVMHPISGESIVLRKTLQRNYLIPGNAAALGSEPVRLVDERWILR